MPHHFDNYKRTQGSRLFCIRSRDLVRNISDTTNSSGHFTLFDTITTSPEETMAIRVINATFPNSWYNLSATSENNTLNWSEGASNYSITIPDGSYSIDELTSQIKTQMETANSSAIEYTFTYDEITNKLTITSNSATITTLKFSESNSCRRFLGFSEDDFTLSSASDLVSDRAVDITDTQNSIYIRIPNLSSSKVIESSSGKYSNILAQVPVDLSRNSFFVYQPSKPFEMEINNNSISTIELSITFQDESKRVHFNRADWEINIELNFYLKPKVERKELRLSSEMKERYNNFIDRQNDNIKRKKDLDNMMELLKQRNIKSN
tara:strand:- start:1434 stop:2399 length:966 start_codon:yes stop_codon:yes gene_type:complete